MTADIGDFIEMADLTRMGEKNEELPRFEEKEFCENKKCNVNTCSLRQPRDCRYVLRNKFCKFDP